MTKIQSTRSSQPLNTTTPMPSADDVGAAPISAPQDQAATFDKVAPKRTSFFGPGNGGDSRVISPSGGGSAEVNSHEAIDGHSKQAGDFTEPRTVNGKSLYFTPEGARAVDAWLARAAESSAQLKAERDPGPWARFWQGDAFDGHEQHSGETK